MIPIPAYHDSAFPTSAVLTSTSRTHPANRSSTGTRGGDHGHRQPHPRPQRWSSIHRRTRSHLEKRREK